MLRVALLGEQAIVDDASGQVPTRSSRVTAVIGFLAVHAGVPQSRQRVSSALWPESSDAQALTNLRRELHHLRQVPVLADALEVGPSGLRWQPDRGCDVDVVTFESERRAAAQVADLSDHTAFLRHADAALAAYRGEFLPGCPQDWAAEVRADLQARYVELCDLVCAARRRRGELAGAAEAARRRIAVRPLEESGYLALMQVQSQQGDRGAAVNTYHGCAAVLERELGMAPGAALQLELRTLLARDRPGDGGSGPVESAPGRADLAGRDAELAQLRAVWRRAVGGRALVVVCRGEPGVGKTRLLTELVASVRREGAVVAPSRCFGATGRLGLAAVADWLRSPAIRSSVGALEPDERAQIERLTRIGSVPGAGTDGSRMLADAWQRHRFFEALAAAVVGSGRPTLLVLDDMQWCDRETLQFLAFLLRRQARHPLLVAATMRDDGGAAAEPGLLRWFAELRRDGALVEVALGPLDMAASARIAESISGRPLDGSERALLHATTGGYPLYIVEAMRSTVGPQAHPAAIGGLDGVLRLRLEQAGDHARDVAGLASVVGRNFTLDLLAEASDLGEDLVVDAVDELWQRRILRESAGTYDFAHDLLRDVAYAQVPPAKRWLWHRRVAQGLERLHADDLDPVAVQIAGHYRLAGRSAPAVTYYRRAAQVASTVFALDDAVALYEEALQVIRTLPAGPGRDCQELVVLAAVAAPVDGPARFRCSEAPGGAGAVGGPGRGPARQRCVAGRAGRSMGLAIRARPHQGQPRGGPAGAGAGRSGHGAQRVGALRRRRCRPQHGPPGRGGRAPAPGRRSRWR